VARGGEPEKSIAVACELANREGEEPEKSLTEWKQEEERADEQSAGLDNRGLGAGSKLYMLVSAEPNSTLGFGDRFRTAGREDQGVGVPGGAPRR
jgi:hypothetical protein